MVVAQAASRGNLKAQYYAAISGDESVQNCLVEIGKWEFRWKFVWFSCIFFVQWCRVGNIILMGYGVGMGWLTTAIPLLQSNETPLETGPMTTEQLSWAGSIISIGALIGNFLFGYCTNAMGSRNAVFFLGIPQMVNILIIIKIAVQNSDELLLFIWSKKSGWLFMYFGRQIWDIIISRFLVGFVIGGLQICNSIYIAEIADNEWVPQFHRRWNVQFL